MDENYLIGVDVEVYGKDRFRELLPLMKEVAQQVGTNDAAFQKWLSSIQKSIDAGYTFTDSMNKASKATGSTKAAIDAFTSSLRVQISEYDRAAAAAEASARRQEVAIERAAARIRAIEERENARRIRQEEQTGNRYAQVFGRIGGRAIGGISGAPGGGFIGSQTVQALGVSGSTAVGIGAAGIGVLAGYEMVKAINDTGKYAQEQVNLSQKLGISAQETQILTGVTKLVGIEFASVQGALEKMARVQGEGTVEARKMKGAFEELGLTAGVSLLKPEEQLRIILESLHNVRDGTERERLAVNLLGNEGRSLLPLVDHFNSLRQAVTASGVVMDKDGIAKMEQYRVNIEKLSLAWEGLKHTLATGAVGIVNFIGDHIPTGRNVNTGFGGVYGLQPWTLDPVMTGGLTAIGRSGADAASIAEGDRRLGYLHQATGIGQSPSERATVNLQYFRDQTKTASDAYLESGSASDLAKVESLQGNVRSNEIALKSARALESQQQEFQKEKDKELNPSTAASDLRTLRNRFNLLRGSSDFEAHYSRVRAMASGALQYREMERFRNDEELKNYTGDQALKAAPRLHNKYPALAGVPEFEDFFGRMNTVASQTAQARGLTLSGELATKDLDKNIKGEQSEEAKRDRTFRSGLRSIGRSDIREINRTIEESLHGDEATQSLDYAYTVGATAARRHKMTQAAFEGAELHDTISNISAVAALKVDSAKSQSSALYGVYQQQQANPETAFSQVSMQAFTDSLDKATEADLLEIKARQESVLAINKFNESVDAAGAKIRDELAGGLTSILIGGQTGGASGARGAARSFAQGIESTALKNFFNVALEQTGIGKPGSGPDPNSTMGKLLQNTPFAGVNRKTDLDDNTIALKDLTSAIRNRSGASPGGSGGSGGGGYSGGGSDGESLPYAGVLFDPKYGPSAGGSTASIAKSVGALSAVLSPLAREVTGGGGGTAITHSAFSALSTLGNVLGGAKYANKIPGILDGSVGLTAGQEVGAFAGAAAAGFGVYSGVSTALKGGARNITSGAGTALLSASAFTGPAAPFVAAAGAGLELISALLPDPKQIRQNDIQNRIFANRYVAPESIHLSQGGNGGYRDIDETGQLRKSNFSPYPVVSDAYLDIPRKTVVPGRTIAGYGGFVNATGADNPQVIIPITVHAMDSKSFNDAAPDIIGAIHHGILQYGAPDLINALGQRLGTR